jgi:hypothetical protein
VLSALPAPVRDPEQVLLGWTQRVDRLVKYGVVLRFEPLPAHLLGDWHSATDTLVIRAGAPLEDQVWLMGQVWSYLAIGPHASVGVRPASRLSLVPAPREAPDTQTA